MANSSSPARRGLVGMVAGLAVGLAVGGFAGWSLGRSQPAPEAAKAEAWIDAGLPWRTLPSHTLAGPLPQTFAIPATAYSYGAGSETLGPLVVTAPSILRVEIQAAGTAKIGLSLTTVDGSTLLSKEKALTAQDGKTLVYFRVGPALAPATLILRNYDSEGQTGSATVSAVSYAREAALSPEELGAINAAGVN